MPLTRPESRGAGASLAMAAMPASRSEMLNHSMSPPVAARNCAPINEPMPGRLRFTFAWCCSANRVVMRYSTSSTGRATDRRAEYRCARLRVRG